jgi:lipooligosaccharide transport system permease protein
MAHGFRAYEFFVVQYRRSWRGTVVTSVVNPVFYLSALGVGLGTLVNRPGNGLGGLSYVDFVAPGMLAATAMQVAAVESSWPVMSAIKWSQTYVAMLATPLGIRDVLAGHQLWAATRVLTSSAVYLVVIAAFGAVHSPLAVFALGAALLTGMAFAAPIAAFAAHTKSESSFVTIFRFAIMPMFLFSGTFFPVSRLPDALQPVAWVTPLWHGVSLCRDLTLGTVSPLPDLGHAAYLAAWAVVGIAVARMTYRRRLLR